jgi:type I restriction enzyme, S subunit
MYLDNLHNTNVDFLYYCLQFNNRKFYNAAYGAAIQNINTEILRETEIFHPPLETQRKIASILSSYDDLIENNSRRIQILEEMARGLYREWFVNFRFPGFEEVEMIDGVPKNWSASTLGEIVVVNKHSIKRGNEPETIKYVDISSVSTGFIDRAEEMTYQDAPGRARRLVKHGDTIWAMVRPNRKIFSAILEPEPDIVVSTGFAVLSPVRVPFSYLYYTVTTDEFTGYLIGRATGAAYPAVSGSDFEEASIVIPSSEILERFHFATEPMMLASEKLRRKNQNLRQTRDLLLPKLIAGEVDVSKLEVAGVTSD